MSSTEILRELDKIIPNPKCSLDYSKDYELLLAVMMSAQSTDARVNSVTKELFKYDLKDLAKMDTLKLESIIKPVGTQKRKAEYIKRICTTLLNDCGGRVPHDRELLESLPGIGHKTCNVVFAEIFNEDAIAVDTHVTRVSKRLCLAEENDDVVKIEKKLMEFFPKDKWSRLHLQLVLFGRHHCTAKKPSCDTCPFKNKQCKKPQI